MNFIEDDLDTFKKDFAEGLDPNQFEAFVKNPSDITEEVMFQLADLIDGKLDIKPRENSTEAAAPDTIDRLMNAITIVYITDENIPVAVASIIDPTSESYAGYIPLDQYSLKSAQNLDGRVQMEFIAIADEYVHTPVEQELVSQLNTLGTPLFAATTENDQITAQILGEIGFKPVSSMEISSNGDENVILWIDKVEVDEDGNVTGENGEGSEEPQEEVISNT
jgi:hypothetical protein